jgi:hypothetical protein
MHSMRYVVYVQQDVVLFLYGQIDRRGRALHA